MLYHRRQQHKNRVFFFTEAPLQRTAYFLERTDVDEEWADVAPWLLENYFEPMLLYALRPGWSESSKELLACLRCELKAYALKRMKTSQVEFVRSARVAHSSPDVKSSTLVLCCDRAGLPENANPKHYITLVCDLSEICNQLRSTGRFDLELLCTTHLVCGQSPDMRRLRLQPPVMRAPETYVLVIFVQRMHDIVFAYDCLKASNKQISECGSDKCQALRAWCGSRNESAVSILDLFGKPGYRDAYIDFAGSLLGIKFSHPQRRVLNELDGPMSVIACIA